MSYCNYFYLFYDQFFEKFGLWKLHDFTYQHLLNTFFKITDDKKEYFWEMSTKEIINEYLYSMSDYESDNYKDKEKLYKKMKKAFLARYV